MALQTEVEFMDAPESELSVINGGDAFRGENVHLSGRKHQDKYLPDEICKFKYLKENCAGPNGVLDGAFQGNCAATLTASLPLGPPLCLTPSCSCLHFLYLLYTFVFFVTTVSLSLGAPLCPLLHLRVSCHIPCHYLEHPTLMYTFTSSSPLYLK